MTISACSVLADKTPEAENVILKIDNAPISKSANQFRVAKILQGPQKRFPGTAC